MQVAAILTVACCALLVHGAAAVWLNVKRRGMIEISNDKAKKIQDLLNYFAKLTRDMPRSNSRSNRLDNARREANNMVKYINNKQ